MQILDKIGQHKYILVMFRVLLIVLLGAYLCSDLHAEYLPLGDSLLSPPSEHAELARQHRAYLQEIEKVISLIELRETTPLFRYYFGEEKSGRSILQWLANHLDRVEVDYSQRYRAYAPVKELGFVWLTALINGRQIFLPSNFGAFRFEHNTFNNVCMLDVDTILHETHHWAFAINHERIDRREMKAAEALGAVAPFCANDRGCDGTHLGAHGFSVILFGNAIKYCDSCPSKMKSAMWETLMNAYFFIGTTTARKLLIEDLGADLFSTPHPAKDTADQRTP